MPYAFGFIHKFFILFITYLSSTNVIEKLLSRKYDIEFQRASTRSWQNKKVPGTKSKAASAAEETSIFNKIGKGNSV